MRYFLTLLVLSIWSCNNSNHRSDAFGNFESDEIFISSETSGKLMLIHKKEGNPVQKGEVVAIVDTSQFFLQKGQIVASIDALKQKLQNIPVQLDVLLEKEKILEKEVKRMQNLFQNGAATQKQFDDLSGELEIVKKQRVALESQLSTANRSILSEIKPLEWRLKQLDDLIDRSVIRSPLDGEILEKYFSTGEIVTIGRPMFKVANTRDMTLRVYVDGSQLSSVKIGNVVVIVFDGNDGQLQEAEGEVTWISSKAEFTPKSIQTRNERVNQVYAVKVTVPNEDGIFKIGMPAEVKFQ